MGDSPRITIQLPNDHVQLDLMHDNFVSVSELELDNMFQTMVDCYEQINRKYREAKRYYQITKRLQAAKRIEKDCRGFFQLRYTETAISDDTDIQEFVKTLPPASFLQAALRLTLNDLRGVRNYHLKDIAGYLLHSKVYHNKHHTKVLRDIPEYKHYLSETSISLPKLSVYLGAPNTPEVRSRSLAASSDTDFTSNPNSSTKVVDISALPRSLLPPLPPVPPPKRRRIRDSSYLRHEAQEGTPDTSCDVSKNPSK